ncbi:MAG: hypothetical protein ACRDLP_09155 [Solirubrobacteraceae bacterium]
MFVLSALAYPLVLAVLCTGAGLAVDRVSGGVVRGVLVPAVGLAALIAVVELTTYISGLSHSTPYVCAAVGAGGLVLGWPRARRVARDWRIHRWQLAVPLAAYVLTASAVLFAGRPTFSAYMVLTDSALHMMGADYLIQHGQHYAHLDLRNSYGQYIQNYYNMHYPTGADGLLGGTAALVRVPDIWAFQPFNAFVLALASGPSWLFARRLRLEGPWAAAAALTATVPALVYAYELIGSIKEITAIPLILTLGGLVITHRSWLRGGARAAIPFAIVTAAGVSALGVAFGAWTVIAVAVLAGVVLADRRWRPAELLRLAGLVVAGVAVLVICALPTWRHVGGSVTVAQAIVTSPNRGNLVSPLRADQVFGAWLAGSYQSLPVGGGLITTDLLIAVTIGACALGAIQVVRVRAHALAAWLALMVLLGVVLTRLGGTWSDAKTLVLTSPALIVLAWGGVAALRDLVGRRVAVALALVLAGGVLASDAIQYHDTDLAPTARYDELASLGRRFAGHGPALFTDFDEYALYELRQLDIGGPDFSYPPLGLVGIDVGHGNQIELSHGRAVGLLAYPLIITRRDPLTVRPPAAYRLVWQGTYYDVWQRRRHTAAAIARFASLGTHPVRCVRVQRLAHVATRAHATLVAASPAEVVRVDLARSRRPLAWEHVAIWYAVASPGTLSVHFDLRHAGRWEVWIQGELMPTISVGVDGRLVGRIGNQMSGDVVVPDTMTPLPVTLAAGGHELSITRGRSGLAPGAGGSSLITSVFLTPSGAGEQEALHRVAPARWRSLCGHPYVWVEVDPSARRDRPARERLG